MLRKYLFLCLLTLPLLLSAQTEKSDVESITETIENYFNGYIHRDINLLNQAFDTENGTMKIATGEAGSEKFENSYFKELMPKWASREKLSPKALENCSLEILNMDIEMGKIGTAKISMKVDKDHYIDILSLQKTKEGWKITNKIFLVVKNE